MLSVNGINQYYGGSHTLREVSFEVPEGSCTVVLGRNGVGKTTLLKCLMGVLPVTSGTITFSGKNIEGMPSHRRAWAGIAYVPQGREIFSQLSVEENLRVGLAGRQDGVRDIPGSIFEMFPVLKKCWGVEEGICRGGSNSS